MRPPSPYGFRAKIGLITPPTNTVNEPEWARLAPDGVSLHTMRMPLHLDHATAEGKAALDRDIAHAARELAKARVDVVAYGCTAGSMVTPPERLSDRIAALSGAKGVTTAHAIVLALTALSARRIAVATPYGAALNEHEATFLTACGFEVLAVTGLGIGAGGVHEFTRIAETPFAAVRAHAIASFRPGADALLISCTDFPTLPIVEDLEAALGAPVVTSNTATFWAALEAAGIDDRIPGAGALLSRRPAP